MYRKATSAFTLLEVILSVSITAVVGVLLVIILIQNNGLFISQRNIINQGLGINDAVRIVSTDAKGATGIAGQYPLTGPEYLASSNTLIMTIPAIDNSGNIIDSVIDYLIYTQDSLNPKVFRKLIFPDELSSRVVINEILLTNLKSFTVDYLDKNNNIVTPEQSEKINMTINVLTRSYPNDQESSLSSQIRFRNK